MGSHRSIDVFNCDYIFNIFLFGPLDPATHIGAVFAGWVSGVALFLIVGLATALVSIAKPEEEPFESRARILFRKQSGAHIDYIVTRIRDVLEHYAEYADRKIIVTDYNDADGKFFFSAEQKVCIRSYIDDVASTYSSAVNLTDATLPPPGGETNRFIFLRVGDDTIGAGQAFTDNFNLPFNSTVQPGASCIAESKINIWTAADIEANTYKPARYTQRMTLTVENHMTNGNVIKVKLIDGKGGASDYNIPPGGSKIIKEMANLAPGVVAYDLRILKP